MTPFRFARPIAALALLLAAPAAAQQRPAFEVEETTIAEVHAALRAGTLTCRALVDALLRRIDAFDKNGPSINAIVLVNPNARAEADEHDRRFRDRGQLTGALDCIPIIVKDNFETVGLATHAGSLSFGDWVSKKDATMVRQVKDAGAIVIAKSNMAEFAFSPIETVSSVLPGYTKNPYALDRVTAGSSGGTAASVAASFGVVGLGTDTGNSIRGPSGHNALVGIRSTMGLTSRAGVVPLSLAADIAGPMARTVADAVAVFQVVVGEDPADPATAAARGRAIPDYAKSLVRDGLKGARIGVLHQAYDTPTTDPEVVTVFKAALEDLVRAGATIVDPANVTELDSLRRAQSGGGGGCNPFKYDLERYIAALGADGPPVKTVQDIIRSRRFHPSVEMRLTQAQAVEVAPEDAPGCKSRDVFRAGLRVAVVKLMDANKLDALVYPTWSNPPRLIGDLNTPGGDNNQLFSPSTGFPAITVPMGYTRGGALPAGVQFFGRPWSEATLIKLAYAYEQATHHRRPPTSTPPLR